MMKKRLLFACLSSLVFACGGGGGSGGGTDEESPDAAADAGRGDAPDAGADVGATDASSPAIAINGKIAIPALSPYGTLPASVTIVTVDAVGARRETKTDASGAFAFAGVQAPYDLAVVGASMYGSQVFTGLSSKTPLVDFWPTFSGAGPVTATVNLIVHMPPCPDLSYCDLQVGMGSEHNGYAETGANYPNGAPSAKLALTPQWYDHGTPENFTVQVLASAQSGSIFWNTSLDVQLSPGGSVSVESTLTSVPTRGEITVTAADSSFSSQWTRDVSVFFGLPGTPNVQMGLIGAEGSSLVAQIPNIPGATIVAVSNLSLPDASPPPNHVYRFAQSSKSGLPLSTTSVSLDVLAAPQIASPQPASMMSATTGAISWTTPGPTTAMIEVDTASAAAFVIATNEKTISLDRLYRLGVPNLPVGNSYLTLVTQPGLAIDDLVDPDPTKHASAWGSGSVTNDQYHFTVAP